MLAHHPLTGQEIRILRTETQISTNLKTLVWVRPTMKPSPRWARWFTVLSEPSAVAVSGLRCTAVIIPKNAVLDDWFPILPTIFAPDSDTLLVAANSTIADLERGGFTWRHTCILEDMYDSYPFLGEPIRDAEPIEKIILSVAHILRMNRIVWSAAADRDTLEYNVRLQYDAWKKHCDGVLMSIASDADDTIVPRTTLIQQYFRHSSGRRNRELRAALEANIACPLIDSILLLNEGAVCDIPVSVKINTIVIGHRLTYYDVYVAIRDRVPAGGFIIYANTDIHFNGTLSYLWKIPLLESRMFIALLRWEENTNGSLRIFGPRSDSQDAWILARDAMDFTPNVEELGFPFGQGGCDNAITLIMMRKKFLVVNPAYSIQAVHLHESNIRNYDPKDVLYKTHYLYVDPTAIQPCHVERRMEKYAKLPTSIQSSWLMSVLRHTFTRPLLGLNEDATKTLCSMMRRDGHTFAPNEKNLWTPPPHQIPLYHLTRGTFVSAEGLLSDFQTIYVGAHSEWIRQWSDTKQSSMMSSIYVPSMVAAPLSELSRKSLSRWVLQYLPRVLMIRRLVQNAGLGTPEFLVPQFSDIGSFLNDCVWSDSEKGNITILPVVDGMNYFSEDVWAVPPSETEEGKEDCVSSEDVQLLRSLLPPVPRAKYTNYYEQGDHPVAVFCVDDSETAVCTRGWAEETADKLFSKGWTIRYVSVSDSPSARRKALSDAAWIFGSSSNSLLDWIWQNQTGATVMEFMPIDAPVADHVHLAGAANLRYIAGVVQKEPIVFQRQNALLDVGRAIKKFGFKELLTSVRTGLFDKPRILVPSGGGDGDAFREMIGIWKDRGYITYETTMDSPFCWWGGIGNILLYEYATHRQWIDIPSYQMALFANPPLPGPDAHVLRQSTWSFWGRRPRMLEEVVAECEHMRGYSSRPIASVFLGKVENGLQLQRRTTVDWSSSCELFSMPVDMTGQAYPYTQREYLGKLCSSRFGLCLPGFGNKCNREIEYFACGVVPIVTSGVDMRHYLVPPRQGVNYFFAETPADVKRIVETTSAETWAKMSAAGHEWWRAYASAEGLFRLTWARIEQCRPYFDVGIPRQFQN